MYIGIHYVLNQEYAYAWAYDAFKIAYQCF